MGAYLQGSTSSRPHEFRRGVTQSFVLTKDIAAETLAIEPHLEYGLLGPIENLLACPLKHRAQFCDPHLLWIVMHPKVNFHGEDELHAEWCIGGDQFALSFDGLYLAINEVDQLGLLFLGRLVCQLLL